MNVDGNRYTNISEAVLATPYGGNTMVCTREGYQCRITNVEGSKEANRTAYYLKLHRN